MSVQYCGLSVLTSSGGSSVVIAQKGGGQTQLRPEKAVAAASPKVDAAAPLSQVLYLQEPNTSAPISVNDINQDGIGDCYLLSAIGELALNRPGDIQNLIHSNPDGTETVTLYMGADGNLPSWSDTSPLVATPVTVDNSFDINSVNNGGDQDVYNGQKEVWVQVLEKALATLAGGYSVVNQGGWPKFVMEELTGEPAASIAVGSLTVQALQGYMSAGDLIAFDTMSDDNSLGYGLVSDHAYMFESLVQLNGQAMVQLGNPWGSSEPQYVPVSQLTNNFDEVDLGTATTQATAPPAPINIQLASTSDSGTPGDGITDVVGPTVTGVALDGSTVTLFDAGGVLGSAVADQYGNWAATLSAMSYGSYNITATATNYVGETSAASQSLQLTIETATPSAPSDIALAASSDSGVVGDDITNDNTPTITGTADAGDTVMLQMNGDVKVGSATADSNGNWDITTSVLPDGADTFYASAMNAAGGSSVLAAFTVTIDTASPVAPASLTLTASQAGNATQNTTPTITGTGEAGDTVVLTDGDALVGTAVVAVNNSWSVTTSALALGSHSLTASETDVADNVSTASAALAIAIVAPPLPPTPTLVTIGGGNQTYTAEAGDTIQAGSGNDTIKASAGDVTVMGSSGQLTFLGGSAASSATGGIGSLVALSGAGGGTYVGGTAGHNILVSEGAEGVTTTLVTAGANNEVFGSATGNDFLSVAGGDTIVGGSGNTTITGGSAAMVVFTGGSTTITGSTGGGDTIVGGNGTLAVAAQNGDAVFGGSGALTVAGSTSGADSIVGGSGAMNVTGRGGNMLVVGGSGNADVNVGNGASLTFAGSGNMTLAGGAGPMQVVAGAGKLQINEGTGSTLLQIVEGAAGGTIAVQGFRPGTDSVDLYGYTAAQRTVTGSSSGSVITLSDGTKVDFMGVTNLGYSIVG